MTDVKEFYKENYKTIKDLSVRHIELVDHAAREGIGLDTVKKMVDITPSVRENDFDELVTRDVEGARELFGDVRITTSGISETEYAIINKSQPKHTKYLTSDGKVYLVSHDVADVGDRVVIRPSHVVRAVTQRDDEHDVWVDKPIECYDDKGKPFDEKYFEYDEYMKVVGGGEYLRLRKSETHDGDVYLETEDGDGTFSNRLTSKNRLVHNVSGIYPNRQFYDGEFSDKLLVCPVDTTRIRGRGEVVGFLHPTNDDYVIDIGTVHPLGDKRYLFINHRDGSTSTIEERYLKSMVEILFVTRNENIPRMAIFGGEW